MEWQKKTFIFGIVVLVTLGLLAGCASQKKALEEEKAAQAAKEREQARLDSLALVKQRADSLAKVQAELEAQKRGEAAKLEEERLAALKKQEMDRAALNTVYFEFDKSSLLPKERVTLQSNAEILLRYGNWNVIVEGHCDERGSTEYNLALGERRAATVRQYYQDYGVNPDLIEIISYGEEHPVDPNHEESAWQKNRRAETKAP